MSDKREMHPEVEPDAENTKKDDGILNRICSCMFTIMGWEFGKLVISVLKSFWRQ